MRCRKIILGLFIVLAWHCASLAAQASVSEQAQRHFDRGSAAVEVATSRSDFEAASRELAEAVRLAPEWPEAHYNLALVREKLEDLDGAMASYRRYLELAPEAVDAAAVRSQLNKIEYKRDKRDEMKSFLDTLASPNHTKKLIDESGSCQPWTQDMVVSGGQVIVVNSLKNSYNFKEIRDWAEAHFIVSLDGRKYNYKAVNYLCKGETSTMLNAPPYCPMEFNVSGEVVSFQPITLKEEIDGYNSATKIRFTCTQTWQIHE